MNFLQAVPLRICFAVGAVSLFAADAASAAPPDREFSIQEIAERMVAGCLKYAADNRFPPLSVAVVDESGTLILFKRQSGAVPVTADAAVLKARTAVRVGASTAELGSSIQDPTVRDVFILLNATTLPGGSPLLRSDGSLRGAVGVSGGEKAQDEACARRALATAKGKSGSEEKGWR